MRTLLTSRPIVAFAFTLVLAGCSSLTPSVAPAASGDQPGAASPTTATSSAPSAELPAPSTTPDVGPGGSAPPSGEPSTQPSAVEPTPDATEEMTGTAGPGCGTGQAGLIAHGDEVPETLQFGRATIEFTNASVSMRNGTYDAADQVPGGIGLAPNEIAVVVGPGDHIILRAVNLTLDATTASVVPWSTVSFASGLGFSSADRVDLAWRVRTDGSLSISAPVAVGDYEVDFGPSWTGACIAGSGVAYGRIKVR
jgi:hypothetical protein